MAEAKTKIEEGEPAPEEGEKVVPGPLIKIEQPLEAREFNDFLTMFMAKAEIDDRRKAALLAARALQNIGIDPRTHLKEAVQSTQFLTAVMRSLPDAGEVTRATKDVITAQGVSQVGGKIIEGPTMDERMERVMGMMMPYMMMLKAMSGDTGGSTKSAEVARLEAELGHVKEQLAAKPIEELKGTVIKIEASLAELKAGGIKRPEEGEAKVVEAIRDLKTTITEKEREKAVEELKASFDHKAGELDRKLDSLSSAMREGGSRDDTLKQASEVMKGLGDFFRGFGDTAKTLGFEPKEEKLTGDRYDKALKLGKKALEVIGDTVRTSRQAPPERRVVATLPEGTPALPPPTPAEVLLPPPAPPIVPEKKPPIKETGEEG